MKIISSVSFFTSCYTGLCINGLIIECTLVMQAQAGIQKFFKLVPGLRREDD